MGPASVPERPGATTALFPDSFLAYIALTPSAARELFPEKNSSTKIKAVTQNLHQDLNLSWHI